MTWQETMRERFPICRQQCYLDAAFGNGGCKASQEALELFFEEQFSGRAEGKKRWNEAADQVRALSAELLGGVCPEQIAITKNTVEGLNIIARGFPWQEGDNVILNDQEHTSNLMPWLALKQQGVDCRIVKAQNAVLTAEMIEEQMDEHTRMVAVSHVQSATGYRCDLPKLAQLCHERGVFLVVDAIQSLGVLPCNAKDWGVDAVAAGGHKGLLAVTGVGILYTSEKLLSQLRPLYGGSSPVDSIDRRLWENRCSDERSARKLELSNLNYPGIYALRAGLQLILDIGVERIWEHIAPLAKTLNEGLRNIGYAVITPQDREQSAGIVSLSVPQPLHMKDWFAQQGICISKMDAGYVRFSLGAFSNDADIQRALQAAEEYYHLFVK